MTGTQAEKKYHAESALPTQRSFVGGDYLPSSGGSTFDARHSGNDRVICEIEDAYSKS